MRILVVGSGGREHALAWKIAQSPLCETLYVAPGNGGTETFANNVALDITDNKSVVRFAVENAIDFVVVGPDAQVVAGMGDAVRAAGITCFAPSKEAAQIEGSKAFTKVLCDEAQIPTAAYRALHSEAEALAYLSETGVPVVIKADGLAAGKGVVVATTMQEAEEAVRACFAGAFGAAGSSVVIEEFLDGEEASVFVLCDGETILPLVAAQDHKRVFDGDRGPNTGGMGAYCPAPIVDPTTMATILTRVIQPAVDRLRERGTPYRGVIFAGLMIGRDGPKLIEFNARFGDPETQALLMLMQSDLVPLLLAAAKGSLRGMTIDWSPGSAITVVMATQGYPGAYGKGSLIVGADSQNGPDLQVFHAGTLRRGGALFANGGRVLNVTATGQTLGEARERAYAAVDAIDWPDGFCRRDIGWRALET